MHRNQKFLCVSFSIQGRRMLPTTLSTDTSTNSASPKIRSLCVRRAKNVPNATNIPNTGAICRNCSSGKYRTPRKTQSRTIPAAIAVQDSTAPTSFLMLLLLTAPPLFPLPLVYRKTSNKATVFYLFYKNLPSPALTFPPSADSIIL